MSLDKAFNLEKDFSPPTYEEWLAAAEESLKGAPFEKLVTHTYEGIDLQPIYTKKDTDGLPGLDQKPGFAGYLRGTSAGGYAAHSWDICQDTRAGLAPQFNEALKTDLQRGQTAINLALDSASRQGLDSDQGETSEVGRGGIAVSTPEDFADALAGIDLEKYPLHIDAGFSGLEAAMMLNAFLNRQKKDLKKIRGSIAADPLGYLASHGNLPVSLPDLYDGMASLTAWARQKAPGLKTIAVNGIPYHDAGADAVRELAYVLATAVEYIDRLLERHLSIDDIAGQMRFTFAVGPFYFMEIAKIRAARVLWAKIVESYGGGVGQKIAVHARTSTYYQTKYDPYVNMLRTTTEAFSAVAAGVDSLHTDPFDDACGAGDEFSRRVARNTQILLREECRLDKLIDPAGGSYYVENLTHQVCQKAWKLFQDIEGKGGMFKALESGFPQEETANLHDKRKQDLAKRKSLIVGTNYSANIKEKKPGSPALNQEELARTRQQVVRQYRNNRTPDRLAEIQAKLSSLEKLLETGGVELIEAGAEAFLAGATLNEIVSTVRSESTKNPEIKPLAFHRAAEIFEELRDAVELFKEKTGTAPKLFIATMGPLSQYKARADFSQAFFEVGGFEVIYPQFPLGKGYETPGAAVEAALQSQAPVVVICSTDDTYPQLAPPITRALKEKNPDLKVILAGFPKDQVDMHKQAGVDEFIYLGADVHQVLSRLLKGLGI